MWITLRLDDALVEAARAAALEQGRTLADLVDEGLRLALDAQFRGGGVRLPSFGQPGAMVKVDIADREQLWTALDGTDE